MWLGVLFYFLSPRLPLFDAGHTSGQGLTTGQVDGQGLLSRQVKSLVVQPVCWVMWLEPIDDGWLVQESVASWDRAQLGWSLQRQQEQQHSCRQATATQHSMQATWHGPRTSDSWLMEENYLVLHRPSPRNGIAYGDNSELCCEHFWGVSSVKTPKTYQNLSPVLIVDGSFSIAGPN